ncbi:SDR family oxidoreductase [Pseudolysinimonas sp.]|uniref:SDR family oxidoreductase n=1 Tax=Pseudolysinimonas sp. TaxID=2680009 RepID=UPI003F7EA077
MRIAVAGGTGAVGAPTVAALRAAGHEAVMLARSAGVDLVAGSGLREALAGTDAVVDVSSTTTTSASASVAFFEAATTNLLRAERELGVGHHVALSIIGVPAAPFGYYAGKARQEELVQAGDVPWTILRAAQFHEFAEQMATRAKIGPIVACPAMRSQPVAAAEVGAVLADIAAGAPRGIDRELAGPEERAMPELVRMFVRATGRRTPVLGVPFPGAWGRSMRDGSLLPGPGARHGAQTFETWLAERTR